MLILYIIFVTKYRRKCLSEIRGDVISSFCETEKISDSSILKIGLGKDHIHMLIESKPSISVEQIVRRLKQMTAFMLWKKDAPYLKTFYWSRNKHLWSSGCFCSTVGDASEDAVAKCIENQG